MEDKKISMGQAMLSVKRIEFLLEEIAYLLSKQISSKEGGAANDLFNEVLKSVDESMKEYIETLPAGS